MVHRRREGGQLDPGTIRTALHGWEDVIQVNAGDVSLPHIDGVQTDGVGHGYVDDITVA